MLRLFKLSTAKHKAATPLEDHLIRTAKTWCQGQKMGAVLKTLDQFHNALQGEKQHYCETHRSARVTSVRLLLTENSVTIGPADASMPPSATITRLTTDERDQLEVQDSLLIPLRSC